MSEEPDRRGGAESPEPVDDVVDLGAPWPDVEPDPPAGPRRIDSRRAERHSGSGRRGGGAAKEPQEPGDAREVPRPQVARGAASQPEAGRARPDDEHADRGDEEPAQATPSRRETARRPSGRERFGAQALQTGGGKNLSQSVAEYMAKHGYRVARDVTLRGRSGAQHILDVLGEKSDEVTSFRVMVHCRDWDRAVDRDTVAGVHLTGSDLGMSRSIVLGARGWAAGAEAAARRLGVELWGPVEIEGRLGRLPDPKTGSALAPIRGLRVNISESVAADIVSRHRRGKLGVNREQIVWLRPFWLPFLPVRVRHTREEKDRFRRPAPRTRVYINVYEALGGSLYAQWDRDPQSVSITEGRVRPKVTTYTIVAEIEEAAKRLSEARTPQAYERHDLALNELGIPTPVSFFELTAEEELYLPFYLALLKNKTGERILAVDASQAEVSEEVGVVVMKHLGHIVDSGGV